MTALVIEALEKMFHGKMVELVRATVELDNHRTACAALVGKDYDDSAAKTLEGEREASRALEKVAASAAASYGHLLDAKELLSLEAAGRASTEALTPAAFTIAVEHIVAIARKEPTGDDPARLAAAYLRGFMRDGTPSAEVIASLADAVRDRLAAEEEARHE